MTAWLPWLPILGSITLASRFFDFPFAGALFHNYLEFLLVLAGSAFGVTLMMTLKR